ncbi:MAG: S8 family serine peptidase, partial [bacterium]|nr:S8 family serine peptidase [bacterium]
HVAGIAAADGVVTGVAPNAQILAYKVLDATGSGYSSAVIAALETAVDPDGDPATDDGADVANLSLGAPGDPDDPLSQAVDTAVDAGMVVVVAAGNSGSSPQSVLSPGTARKAITVGSTYKSDVIAQSSSRGPVIWQGGAIIKPDIVAPGASICSSRWDSAWLGRECIDQAHIAISGTSMATPHVAGAAALLLDAHPDWTPAEVKMALRDTAR